MIFTEVLKRREISRDFTAAASEHGTVIIKLEFLFQKSVR
jgi:hypothetical protein